MRAGTPKRRNTRMNGTSSKAGRRTAQRAAGYSCTMRDGRLVRVVGDVEPGALIVTHVADGSFDSVVGASHRRPARSRTARSSEAGVSPDQMDLFSAAE